MVTIPTLDEIAGSTVMVKLRELIKKFIGFASEVDAALDDRYTKAEVNTIANNISADVDKLSDDVADNTSAIEQINTDLGTNYYTKQEVNNINNLVNYYNTTSLNETFEHINERIISGEEQLADDIAGKQDILTAGDNITIVNNVISATSGSDWELFTGDRSTLISNGTVVKDIKMLFVSNTNKIKGISFISKNAEYSINGVRNLVVTYNPNALFGVASFSVSSGNCLLTIYNFSSVGGGANNYVSISTTDNNYNYNVTSGNRIELYVRD